MPSVECALAMSPFKIKFSIYVCMPWISVRGFCVWPAFSATFKKGYVKHLPYQISKDHIQWAHV